MRDLYKYQKGTNPIVSFLVIAQSLGEFITTCKYTNQITSSSVDEIEELNNMQTELEQNKAELQQAKSQLEAEQKNAEDALAQAQQLRSEAQAKAEQENAAELAFWGKFGFAAEGGQLVRRRTPDLTAVKFVQDFLAARLVHQPLCVDATCGNGGDTAFLCRLVGPEGRVLGFDIQPEAITSTRARLEKQGLTAELICDSHANLLQYVRPGTADIVMFNFGWLPGADHSVFSTADSSIPALEAALAALRAGGVLSAILYSGRVIGTDEKQSILGWLRSLPLEKYTVLVCDFANWADTAPLPCLVLKK